MKARLFWIAVMLLAGGAFYFATIRPLLTPPPGPPRINRKDLTEFRPAPIPAPPLPAPLLEMPVLVPALPATLTPATIGRRDDRASPPLEVPIQNGATIDFSLGSPMVRSQGADQAALEKALKEMADATKDVQFGPPAKK